MADEEVNDATAYIDSWQTLEMKEKWGSIVSITRVARVCGLFGVDYSVMYDALTAAGVPGKGEQLDDTNPHLVVTDRDVKMIDDTTADVTIAYGPFNDEGQSLNDVEDFSFTTQIAGKMSTTVSQKETNQYTNEAGDKVPIILSHTYPDDTDPDLEADPDYAGKTIQQTGLVNVNLPQRTFTIEGIKNVEAPWEMAESLIRAVNDDVWLGQPSGTWMCTEVSWKYREYSKYFMQFTFQHEEDGWNPTAVFIDDRTGRPPDGVVDGEGVLTVPYFREKNFPQELGFLVIGPAQNQ